MHKEGDLIFVTCPEPTCGKQIPVVFSDEMDKILCMSCNTVGKIVIEKGKS